MNRPAACAHETRTVTEVAGAHGPRPLFGRLHPAVHVVLLIVIAAGIAGGSGPALALGTAAVSMGLCLSGGGARWPVLMASVLRLRLFFLSLILLYGWFQPGAALIPALGGYSPSAGGLVEGARHALVLIVMVAAVHWLMNAQGLERVIAGLTTLLAPLTRIGVPARRFALRLVLAIRLVPELRTRAAEAARADAGTGPWRRRARIARRVFQATIEAADHGPAPVVHVPVLPRPSPWQWLLPGLLACAFVLLVLLAS